MSTGADPGLHDGVQLRALLHAYERTTKEVWDDHPEVLRSKLIRKDTRVGQTPSKDVRSKDYNPFGALVARNVRLERPECNLLSEGRAGMDVARCARSTSHGEVGRGTASDS